MTRLVAILVTLFLVAIPAKADVALWPRVPGWTVIQVYGVIKAGDLATFQRYTENVDPAATLVIVTGPGGNLSAGIGMGIRVHLKKLIVGAKGMCASSCALIWMGGETGRKFIYRNQGTGLCFHQAFNPVAGPPGHVLPGPPSGSGNAFISKYLADLGYNQDMIVWATIADPQHRLCLNPGLAEKKFHIDFWYNTEDGQHYTLPGNHGLLPPAPPAPLLSQGDGATPLNPSLPNGWSLSLLPLAPPVSPLSQGELTPPAAPLTYDVWYWSAPTQKWVTEDWVLTSEGCMKRVQQIYDDVTHPPFCRLHPKGD